LYVYKLMMMIMWYVIPSILTKFAIFTFKSFSPLLYPTRLKVLSLVGGCVWWI
jgi:hypothetical protein